MARIKREDRVSVNGTKDILTVRKMDKEPGMEYRWVLDIPGRIDRFKEGGWDVVQKTMAIGQKAVDSASQVGSAVIHVRAGQTLVLMSIPKEWYDEDQKTKQDDVDSREKIMNEDIRMGRFPGSGSSEKGNYVPEGGGLSITRK